MYFKRETISLKNQFQLLAALTPNLCDFAIHGLWTLVLG